MIEEEVLEELKCALSDEQHFSIQPITLTKCGHSVCKNCLPVDTNEPIKCKICNLVTIQDYRNIEISKGSRQALRMCLDDIFSILEKELSYKFDELKKNLMNKKDELEIKINYIEEEIDIRVESIKNQLNEASVSLKLKIREMTEELSISDDEAKIDSIDLTLSELRNNINREMNLNEDYLDQFQKKVKELKVFVDEYDDEKFPQIKISNEKINLSLIGKLYLDKKSKDIDVVDLLKNGKKEVFDLNLQPIGIVCLPDNQIVCISHKENLITVYDQNFNLMKNINILNDQPLDPIGIALNKEDEQLYIIENTKHRIIMADLDFNFIKYFGSQGCGNLEFDFPVDIYFKNSSIYVCDYDNKRIQIFNKDLEFTSTLKIDYNPWKIKVSSRLVCVKSITGEIYFYNLTDLSLHRKYNNEICRISEYNSCFYEFVFNTKKLHFYDKHGDLKEELKIENFGQYLTNGDFWDGAFIDFKGDLLMLSQSERKVIKFSKK